MNSFQAETFLRNGLGNASQLGFSLVDGGLTWWHDGREYLVSLVLFDVTKEEV